MSNPLTAEAPAGFKFDHNAAKDGLTLWRGPREDLGRVQVVTDYSPNDGLTVSITGAAGTVDSLTPAEAIELRDALTTVLDALLRGSRP